MSTGDGAAIPCKVYLRFQRTCSSDCRTCCHSGGRSAALLGENGAGKSTLMNILGGVLPADRGEIVIDGAAVHFRTPSDSLSAGVAFIHQELSLINDLAIYENMFIGRELKTKYGLLDAKTMIQKTQEVFDRLELHLDPRTMVRELDASYKQIVEISRAMMMEASLIIMDEPTTSLTDPEIERVFDMMRMLQKQNVAIVFISHKLKEVMEVCNRYTVLRDGNMVAAGPVAEVTTADLARFMVGHDVRTENLHQDKELGGEILRGEGLGDGAHFRDISFTVHAGEVLGVTGLLGDGRSELFQAVFGRPALHRAALYGGPARQGDLHPPGHPAGHRLCPPQPQGERHHQGHGYRGERLHGHPCPRLAAGAS